MFTIRIPHYMRKNIKQNWDRETKCYHVFEEDFGTLASLFDYWDLPQEGLVAFRDGLQMEMTDPIQQGDDIKVTFMSMGG